MYEYHPDHCMTYFFYTARKNFKKKLSYKGPTNLWRHLGFAQALLIEKYFQKSCFLWQSFPIVRWRNFTSAPTICCRVTLLGCFLQNSNEFCTVWMWEMQRWWHESSRADSKAAQADFLWETAHLKNRGSLSPFSLLFLFSLCLRSPSFPR